MINIKLSSYPNLAWSMNIGSSLEIDKVHYFLTNIHEATTLINLYFFASIKLMSENHIPNACSNQCLRTFSSGSILSWCLPEYLESVIYKQQILVSCLWRRVLSFPCLLLSHVRSSILRSLQVNAHWHGSSSIWCSLLKSPCFDVESRIWEFLPSYNKPDKNDRIFKETK